MPRFARVFSAKREPTTDSCTSKQSPVGQVLSRVCSPSGQTGAGASQACLPFRRAAQVAFILREISARCAAVNWRAGRVALGLPTFNPGTRSASFALAAWSAERRA